ncbi:hypothetical protein MMC13_002520 [Lambiella insularis]|nr:hypothetical protein [Lambiella insularis]
MKTSVALSLRYLTSKIHPPLPLNRRDSQKLLSLLTSSFRENLDQEHGKAELSKPNATDVHFQSMLDNPLFNLPRRKDTISLKGRDSKALEIEKLKNPSHDEDCLGRSPLEHFKNHIASGAASIKLAKQCLTACLVTASSRRNALHVSDVSATMLQWLWSSGLEERLEFLEDMGFVQCLTPFLVMDGRDHHLIKWLSKLSLMSREFEASRSSSKVTRSYTLEQSKLLFSFVRSEISHGSRVNGALEIFVKAVDSAPEWSAKVNPCSYTMDSIPAVVWQPVRRAGRYLLSVLAQSNSMPHIDPGTFDKFFHSLKLWSRQLSFDCAMVALLHPVSPDPQIWMQYVCDGLPDAIKTFQPDRRELALDLCLKSSQMLLTRGKVSDALLVSDLTRDIFKRELASPPQEEWRLEALKERHLRELETLAVA